MNHFLKRYREWEDRHLEFLAPFAVGLMIGFLFGGAYIILLFL